MPWARFARSGPAREVRADKALPAAHCRDLGPFWILRRFPVPGAGIQDDEVMEGLTAIAVSSHAPVVPSNISNSEALRGSNQKLQEHKHCIVCRCGRRFRAKQPHLLHQDAVCLLPKLKRLVFRKIGQGMTEVWRRLPHASDPRHFPKTRPNLQSDSKESNHVGYQPWLGTREDDLVAMG